MKVYEKRENQTALTDGIWVIWVDNDDVDKCLQAGSFEKFFGVRDVEDFIRHEFGDPEGFRYC